jgi:hypothetical protein
VNRLTNAGDPSAVIFAREVDMDNATDELTRRCWRTAFRQHSLPSAARRTDDFTDRGAQPADGPAARQALLDCYVQGWAEANPLKIVLVTAPDYRFNDPLVGVFGPASLPRYFDTLRRRFAVAGVMQWRETAFVLRGNDAALSSRAVLQFYREAPHMGLTGISTITLGDRGIHAETVAYDSNLALEVLTRPLFDHGTAVRQPPTSPDIAA